VVEVPDGGRRLTAAEKETAQRERAVQRSDRMSTKAEKLTTQAETHRAAADRISQNIPFGQPILLGHHSEPRALRDADRIRSNIDRSSEYAASAEAAQAAAVRAERTATGAESVVTITNRIERNEALVRKVDRELADHASARGIVDRLGADHPTVAKVGPERLGVRGPERLAQLQQLKAEALDAIGHDRTKLAAAGGVAYGKHNVEPGDLICTREGYTPVIRANAKTATVPTGYSWTDTIPWSRVRKVVKAEKFTPDQVREILEAVEPGDKHRAAAFQKTLARAEAAEAAAAGAAPTTASVDKPVAEPEARPDHRPESSPAGSQPADTIAAAAALERARTARDGTYAARYAEWHNLAQRDIDEHLAAYRAMSPQEQDQAQREGLMAVNRIVDNWLDLRAQVAQAPEVASEQPTRSDPAAWSREDDSLLEPLDVDASARQRLSARPGTTGAGLSAPPGPAPGG